METPLIYSHTHLQGKWTKTAQPALTFEWLTLQPQCQSFNRRHSCIYIPGGGICLFVFRKARRTLCHGCVPHHWCWPSRGQRCRLPSALCEEQPEGGDTSARCLVTKLTHALFHINSPTELFCPFPKELSLLQTCHIIFPLTKVPVSLSCQPCPYSSPFPALISLLSHSQYAVPSHFAMHFQFSLIFHPFHPSRLTIPSSSLS